MPIQSPVYVRDLFGGKVTIIVFGAPFNWNYAGASREEMEKNNPGITAALQEVIREYGIKRALVPKPVFNAKVVTDEDLPNELLPNFFRGADADGVILEKSGDAYFLASADCLTTVLYSPAERYAMALHCGRDALMDRQLLNSDRVSRPFSSVIDHAEFIGGGHMPNFQAFLAAGIRPGTFDHPIHDEKYGAANKRMIDHIIDMQLKRGHLPWIVKDESAGKIDLFALVRHQLDAYGVTQIEEDEFDTATSRGADGEFLFHSNRRDKVKRNLVVKLN